MSSNLLDPTLLQALRDLQSSKYMNFAASTMWIYDFLLGISDEVRIFSSRSLKLPDVIYICSRILVFCHVFVGAASEIIPEDSCLFGRLTSAVKWLVAFSIPCSSWIFFVRVRAAYNESRIIIGFFATLWACTLLSFGTPFTYSVTVTPIGDGVCAISAVFNRSLEAVCLLSLAIFDTAVMIGISIRIMSYSISQTWKSKLFSLIFGDEMGHTSKLFLRSSQIYYFSTFSVQFALVIMVLSNSIPTPILGMVALLQTAFQNIMVCRVYRMMKLDSDPSSTDIPSYITPVFFNNSISAPQVASSLESSSSSGLSGTQQNPPRGDETR